METLSKRRPMVTNDSNVRKEFAFSEERCERGRGENILEKK